MVHQPVVKRAKTNKKYVEDVEGGAIQITEVLAESFAKRKSAIKKCTSLLRLERSVHECISMASQLGTLFSYFISLQFLLASLSLSSGFLMDPKRAQRLLSLIKKPRRRRFGAPLVSQRMSRKWSRMNSRSDSIPRRNAEL